MLLYSPDSAIDGAVLDVILAEATRKTTGVTMPLPEERGAVTGPNQIWVMDWICDELFDGRRI